MSIISYFENLRDRQLETWSQWGGRTFIPATTHPEKGFSATFGQSTAFLDAAGDQTRGFQRPQFIDLSRINSMEDESCAARLGASVDQSYIKTFS